MIWASIIAGSVEAGKFYPVSYFASQLGVSATPIREALFDLSGMGLVEMVRNKGVRVPMLDERELDEILDLRMLVERPAVCRLATNSNLGDTVGLRRMAESILTHAEQGNVAGFLTADRLFHHELLMRAGNRRLVQLVMSLRDQARLYGLGHLAEAGELRASGQMHLELLDALERKDVSEVDRLIGQHLMHTRKEWAGVADHAEAMDDHI